MKIKHLLLFGALAALGSCTTAYRSGQTPDDVYYSPAPEQSTYVSTVSEKDQNSYSYRNDDEENDIRRGIQNPIYRNSITFSMGMGYSPYSLYPYNAFNNPFYYDSYGYSPYGMKGMYSPYYSPYIYNDFAFYNPYSFYNYSPYSFGYGYGFNPYAYSPIFLGGSLNTHTGARKYNLNAYNHTGNSGVRGNLQPSGINPSGTSMPIRSSTTENAAPVRRSGVGNVIRRVFTPSERNTYNRPNNNTRVYRNTESNRTYNNNNDYNRTENQAPVRSFTPSQSSPSSSSSSSSSSAPVRTFRR
ncbi:MAG TPA: hypothetical protein VFU62_07745 [Hanamia sp.]|nr:hypothetical protein [Hanamia sp.]